MIDLTPQVRAYVRDGEMAASLWVAVC